MLSFIVGCHVTLGDMAPGTPVVVLMWPALVHLVTLFLVVVGGGDGCGWRPLMMVRKCCRGVVVTKVGGGGKKRMAVFGEYDCQINIVCYPSQINKL